MIQIKLSATQLKENMRKLKKYDQERKQFLSIQKISKYCFVLLKYVSKVGSLAHLQSELS